MKVMVKLKGQGEADGVGRLRVYVIDDVEVTQHGKLSRAVRAFCGADAYDAGDAVGATIRGAVSVVDGMIDPAGLARAPIHKKVERFGFPKMANVRQKGVLRFVLDVKGEKHDRAGKREERLAV